MKGPEVKFYNRLSPYLPGIHDRVENFAAPGMPDVYGVCRGRHYWVELKSIIAEKKRPEPCEYLNPNQIGWQIAHAVQGDLSLVLIHAKAKKKETVYIYFCNNINVNVREPYKSYILYREVYIPDGWVFLEESISLLLMERR